MGLLLMRREDVIDVVGEGGRYYVDNSQLGREADYNHS